MEKKFTGESGIFFSNKSFERSLVFPHAFFLLVAVGDLQYLRNASKTKKKRKNWDFFKKKNLWGFRSARNFPISLRSWQSLTSIRFFRQKIPQSWINPWLTRKATGFFGEILPNGQALGYGGFVTNWQRQKKNNWNLRPAFLYSSFHVLFVCFRKKSPHFGKRWITAFLSKPLVSVSGLRNCSKTNRCCTHLSAFQMPWRPPTCTNLCCANPRNMSLNCART